VEPDFSSITNRFNEIRRVAKSGVEFWLARELQGVLGYGDWTNFENAITRAMKSCESVGVDPTKHFRETTKMVELGSGASRAVRDYFLARYACYLIAMNGDPKKPEIAAAQAYFAVQARRMEVIDELPAQEKRWSCPVSVDS
jgi:DNA-damage-inducible protein D